METQTSGLHHAHVRKRSQSEQFPHPHPWKKFLDKAIIIIGLIGPIMTIPQIVKIWSEKNAAGVSALSWSAYLFTAVFWLLYGLAHKEKPIILTYGAFIVLDIFIIIGTIIY